ncbi:DUF1257 domain-containing protein [Kovacikia minuta CCNUW1]|uniref:DUF1257 domain-containing protein n=1 Tax=Kovacikia minuta TaxID=2931930 RepID=UPI001CCFC544|nr:DUF1257 domain-containing protein [Kovacikia minuta]UBF29308.1 DUF1257 domain-containing protein [Kovacikia minuta CCNUW1]
MSHFSTLRSKLSNAEILKASLQDLGFTVRTNAEVRGYGCQQVHADIVAELADGYDIGWSQNVDGSFDLVADLWAVSRRHNLAELMNSVNQKYAVNKTLAAVKRPGLQNANVQVVVQS